MPTFRNIVAVCLLHNILLDLHVSFSVSPSWLVLQDSGVSTREKTGCKVCEYKAS